LQDSEIIQLLKGNTSNKDGYRALLDKYQERLYWHVRRIVIVHEDADDTLQNVWIKVYSHIDTFAEASSLYTWLYRIATHEALNTLSKRKRHASDVESYLENTLVNDPYFDGDETALKLKAAIAMLPEKQMLVFNMKYYQELKYHEMSEILNTSVGALKASYHHAVKKIKKTLLTDNIEI